MCSKKQTSNQLFVTGIGAKTSKHRFIAWRFFVTKKTNQKVKTAINKPKAAAAAVGC
jgi:hypothetical protein